MKMNQKGLADLAIVGVVAIVCFGVAAINRGLIDGAAAVATGTVETAKSILGF